MKSISSFLSIVFTVIFIFQSSAWASKITPSSGGLEIIQETVQRYNSLSQENKRKEFQELIKSLPKNDQAFIKNNLGDLSKAEFPQLKYKNGTFHVPRSKGEFPVTLKSGSIVSIYGTEVDLSPGKLEEATYVIEKILARKSAIVLDLFISKAHALSAVVAQEGLMAIILIVVFANAGWTYYKAQKKNRENPENAESKKHCQDLEDKVDEFKTNRNSTPKDLEILKMELKKARNQLLLKGVLPDAVIIKCIDSLEQEIKVPNDAIMNEDRTFSTKDAPIQTAPQNESSTSSPQ